METVCCKKTHQREGKALERKHFNVREPFIKLKVFVGPIITFPGSSGTFSRPFQRGKVPM